MKAAFIRKHGGTEVLEVGSLPDPEISAGEVLVRVKVSALNHLDIWVRKGLPIPLTYPHILGSDASGVVEKIGAGVTHVKSGDEVLIHPGLSCLHCGSCLSGWESLCPSYQILGEHLSGTNAEWVRVPAANVYPKPKGMSFEEAASFALVFTTAWQMLVRRANVQPGDTVLIHAAGSGVSSAAIQIAKLFGAQIIATAGGASKLELARKLGAHHTVNYREKDFVSEVKQITEKRGVDIIVDHVGAEMWEKNFKAVRWGGKIVTCGATSGAEVKTDLRQVFFRQIQILGSTMGSKGDFPRLLRLADQGHLKAVVDKIFPLEEIREAHVRLESREILGKVLIKI